MRIPRSVALIAATLTATVAIWTMGTSTAYADGPNADNNVSTSEVTAALANDGALATSPVPTTSDADSAAVATTLAGTVDIPRDASEGMELTTPSGYTLNIIPPNADNSGAGRVVSPGVVAYGSSDGTGTAMKAEDNGGRMLTTIANPDADTMYPYQVNGAGVQLNDDGSLTVIAPDGTPLYGSPAPYAHDANGVDVPTKYVLTADGVAQFVDHKSGNFSYPIVADPFWSALGNYLGCILGVGVPIGLAVVIAALPATWYFMSRWAAMQSATMGRAIISYVNRVHDMCHRFIVG